MPFLYQKNAADYVDREIVKEDAATLWTTKTAMDFDGSTPKLQFNSDRGIGLNADIHHPAYPAVYAVYKDGWFITGTIDCGPNVTEYGRLTLEEDIYFGYSGISWQVRTSSTGDAADSAWSRWYDSLYDVPVKQFVQFKFTFNIME
jgi:hypothetical protein